MTTETISHLNTQVLIGFTDQRGTAWHYKKDEQGDEPNHYAGAIPIDDVRRRLFDWHAESVPMFVDGTGADGGDVVVVPNRRAIIRDDTHDVLGVVSESYVPHQYDEWLLNGVANIIDDNLAIGSAGLLKGGAVAWVQVEMPENMKVEGVEFRPHLLATTSFNGEIASTYKRTCTIVVCDNTRARALAGKGEEVRVKHTSRSGLRIHDARDALNIVHDLGDAFEAEIRQLMSIKVSDRHFDRFLNVLVPADVDDSRQLQTRAEGTRNVLRQMWQTDIRCAPFRNTGFGVVQTVNTWRQHLKPTRNNRSIIERNMIDTLTGVTEASDREVVGMLVGTT